MADDRPAPGVLWRTSVCKVKPILSQLKWSTVLLPDYIYIFSLLIGKVDPTEDKENKGTKVAEFLR